MVHDAQAQEAPEAAIRTEVMVPLALPGGTRTVARVYTFDGLADGLEHLALGLGDRARVGEVAASDVATDTAPAGNAASGHAATAGVHSDPPLTRLHSECLTGDVFGSQRCDCGPQLSEAVKRLSRTGGYLLYLRQEGRGIGLYSKLDAYLLQDSGLDTYEANVALGYEADERDYTAAAQMLKALGVTRVALLSNNPDKAAQLNQLGITVARRVPTEVHLSAANADYLAAKAEHGAHTLDLPAARRRGTS